MNQFDINRCEHKYVLVFAFTADLNQVALVVKDTPAWQRGKLNGIGGKVETDEAWSTAMTREFKEETGVYVCQDQWVEFAVLHGKVEHAKCSPGEGKASWAVKCYAVKDPDILNVRTMEVEQIRLLAPEAPLGVFKKNFTPANAAMYWRNFDHVRNLEYLVPMALLRMKDLRQGFVVDIEEY